MSVLPRSEYPRPQFVRNAWVCLNGEWEFAFDDGNVGRKEKWQRGETALEQRITVPFSFESKLSGIGEQGFHDNVWYRRMFEVPPEWDGKRVHLHFGPRHALSSHHKGERPSKAFSFRHTGSRQSSRYDLVYLWKIRNCHE
ncbi:sugar-binding domain-containing protein [Paenibacillus silviterrae]|uniref:sugar-binding domain-containing protein n=1 Tax=Paenibacillus silviterrae TaxID=3242194 RepID=UPI002542B9B3|nr:sugar-binding domain-containing protein [Paenibacillus chinjuensis]